ncbi:hypothetical protein [Corynebacterium nuruki]|uniref:hypothetical protein n=1 Tax=Corynebacterium nuruki TaxID=1032851 RepID=UPI0002485DE9|nr:hypothetical protein [Corynebacterium nuruki]
MLYTEPVGHPAIEELTVYPLNRAELRLADAFAGGRSAVERTAVENATRGRGAAYVARVRHTTEMSWRMPVLFSAALDDGRMTVDHFDALWRRMDRHPCVRAEVDSQIIARENRAAERARREELREQAREAGEPEPTWDDEGYHDDAWDGYSADPVRRDPFSGSMVYRLPDPENGRSSFLDEHVERVLLDWLRDIPHRLSSPGGEQTTVPRPTVTIHRLREAVDRALDDAAEDLERYREQGQEMAEQAEQADRDRLEAAARAKKAADTRARKRAERAARRKAEKVRDAEQAAKATKATKAAKAGTAAKAGDTGKAGIPVEDAAAVVPDDGDARPF